MSISRRELLRSLLHTTGSLAVGGSVLGALPAGRAGARLLAQVPPPAPETLSIAGTREPSVPNVEMEPYRIDFPPAAIEDLHRRIDATRWPEMPFETGWESGTNDAVLRELVAYWRNDYDWFAVQERLNQRTHLRGPIEGEQLHCVVYEGEGADAPGRFPLLLLHGWPGSFHEFDAAAPRLAAGQGGAPGFDLVVPSLPGFAFSEAPRERGMNPTRIAERLHLLMGELGFERYGVQGGDWGSIIATQMARLHPEALVGLHLNFVASAPAPPDGVEPSAEEVAYRAARARFQGAETGYSSIQGTRPQSLAYAQNDSPVGLLAWILEKYWAWSDHGDDLWETFSRDDILTTVMLYWLPGRVLSSARIYYETSNPIPGTAIGGRVEVPTGYARFPAEPWGPPREVVERTYNLVHYSEPERGGHFPALERTMAWAEDVARFFGGLRA
ncbi:MAG: epoxide hydrolase [Gemmatimonadota bacterium]